MLPLKLKKTSLSRIFIDYFYSSGGEISGVGVVIEDCTSKVWDMAKVFQPVTLVLSACKEILVEALYSLLNYFYAMRVYYTEGYIPVLQRFYAR